MAELSAIINMRIPVKFDFHGTEIELAYRPYSEKIEQEVKGSDAWTHETMKALVARVVLDWNLTDQGKPVPVDMEHLTDLPLELQLDLFYAVQNDLRAGKLPNVISSATS